MDSIRLKARAKINLTLDVLEKRPDNYHNIKTIIQSIRLCDDIYMKRIEEPKITLKSNLRWLPVDDKNLAYKAAEYLKYEYNIKDGVFIEIKKRIPVAAGLAGGSSDCAAVLVGMNKIFDLKLSGEQLMDCGARFGSDIPFCILRGTALAEGVGEILTPVKNCPPCYIVLVKPPFSVSTASVYRNLKSKDVRKRPDTKKMIEAINAGNIEDIGRNLCNVLEEVTVLKHPEINSIKEDLIFFGALGALMSGSGPTVFGLFDNAKSAEYAVKKIKHKYKYKDVFLTGTFQNNNER